MLYLLKKTLLYIEEQNVWLSQLQSAIVEREQKYLLLHSLIVNQINEEMKNERNDISENNALCDYVKVENINEVVMISERRNDASPIKNHDVECSNDLSIQDGYYDIAEVRDSDNEMVDSNETDLNEEEMDNTSSNSSTKDDETTHTTHNSANVEPSSTDQNLTNLILEKNNGRIRNIKNAQPKNNVVVLKGLKKHFKCPFCEKNFQVRCQLRYHMRTHTGEKPFGCSECDQFFARRSTLRKHQMRIHADEKPFNCEQCHKSYALRADLTDHLRGHSNDRDRQRHNCSYCNKIYFRKKSLTEHIRKVHGGGEKLNCKYCDKAFKYYETLKDHLRKHVDAATYKCSYCDDIFNTILSHKKHVQLHEEPFQCPICSKSFSDNSHFTDHMTTHK